MINKLINLANELDQRGLQKEANHIDSLLRKAAGKDSGLEHETHPASLEFPGGMEAEAEESMREDARKVAEWVVGGSPIFGPDAEESIDELTDILSAPDHADAVQAILDYFSDPGTLSLEKGSPPSMSAEKAYADPEDTWDPFKQQEGEPKLQVLELEEL